MNDTIMRISGAIIAIVLVLLLGLLASVVGGIGIRHDFSDTAFADLIITNPVVRGLPATVRWEASDALPDSDILLLFRDAHEEYVVGQGSSGQGVITVIFPCDIVADTGSVVLLEQATARVLGQAEIRLLPAGADCAY